MQRKPIKLKHGKVKALAIVCKVSEVTVRKAMNWDTDSDIQNLVRQRARELNYIKRF